MPDNSVMSQNEIDELLSALAGGGGSDSPAPQAAPEPVPAAPQASSPPPAAPPSSVMSGPQAQQQQPPQFQQFQQQPQQQAPQQFQQPQFQQQQFMGPPPQFGAAPQFMGPPPQFQQQFFQMPMQPGFMAPPPSPEAPQQPTTQLLAKAKLEKGTKKTKPYDFRRPDKFVKEQLRTINKIHENFSRTVTTSLSTMLRTMVSVKVISVDQITYEEYIRSVPNPSVISVFDVGGDLKGNAVFEINPSLALAMIDRLFGGTGKALSKSRPLTTIEETVMKKIIARLLNDLTEAWQQFVSIEPKIELMESNPQFTQIAPPTAMVLLITFEVRVHDTEGTSNICFPHIVLEPILEKLNVQFLYSSINKIESEGNASKLEESLKKAKIPLVVELGRSEITVSEFLNLNINDVIILRKSTSDLLDVHAGGRLKFKGNPGLVDNKLAVAIAQVVRENEEEVGL